MSVYLVRQTCTGSTLCYRAVLAVAPSPCPVSVSVCATSRYCIETAGRIKLIFGMAASFDLKEIHVYTK